MKRAAAALLLALLLVAAWVAWPRPLPATGAWMAAAGVEPRFETIEGLRIRYVRRGSGPPVVLLHGIASSLYTWKDVLPGLAEGHDVVALDFPGFGGSDIPASLAPQQLEAAVVGLMDRLAIERAALVGNSLGGLVATLLAAQRPERVERLVLVDAAGFRVAAESRPALLRWSAGPVGAAFERLPRARPLLELGLRQVFHDPSFVTPERIDEYEAPLLRPGAIAALRSLLNAPAPPPGAFEAMLRDLRQPTLVVWGAQDRWIPVADADRFAAAIPGARKAVLDACGHVPQEERPAETLRLAREFLRPSG